MNEGFRNQEYVHPHVVDFSRFDWSFAPGMTPTDIELMFERKGQCFIHEYKELRAKSNRGQEILHQALLELGFTVFKITHKGPVNAMNLLSYTVTYPRPLPGSECRIWRYRGASRNVIKSLNKVMAKWYELAEEGYWRGD